MSDLPISSVGIYAQHISDRLRKGLRDLSEIHGRECGLIADNLRANKRLLRVLDEFQKAGVTGVNEAAHLLNSSGANSNRGRSGLLGLFSQYRTHVEQIERDESPGTLSLDYLRGWEPREREKATLGYQAGQWSVYGFSCPIEFSPQYNRVASRGLLGDVSVFDSETGKKIIQIEPEGTFDINENPPIRFSPDEETLALGNQYGNVSVYETTSGIRLYNAGIGIPAVTSLAFTPDGGELLMGNEIGELATFDAKSGKLVRQVPLGHDLELPIQTISFSRDGRLSALLERGILGSNAMAISFGRVRVFETESWEIVFEARSARAPDAFVHASLSPDGKTLATVIQDLFSLELALYDVRKEEQLQIGRGQEFYNLPSNAAFSSDGSKVVLISSPDLVLLDLNSQEEPREFAPLDFLVSVAFQPNDTSLLVGTSAGMVTTVSLSEFGKPRTWSP